MSEDQIAERIAQFIKVNFLAGDPQGELQDNTPLLEWGVLNSLNTVRLVTFIRNGLGVKIPPLEINGSNFKDVSSIAKMVVANRS
jgi:acyl carrier protein